LSPWNQGTRPDEPAELYLQDPLIDYVSVTDDLREIEYHGQEKKGDHDAHRYEGIVDETDLGALGHDGGRGDIAEVTLWIDTTSLLPVRFEARVRYDRIVVEFLDYDLAVVAPDAPADARPFRDVQLPDAACIGSAFKDCLPAQAEISGSASCAGTGKRVCLVPLGQISAALVQHLVDTYRDDYDLDVTVLTATAIPPALADPQRQQVDADRLIEYMGGVFPDEYRDPQVTLIGVTIVDLYDSTSHFRYVFGVKGTPADPKAVVSNFRMDPATYSEPRDDELLFARTRKLVSKYIGLLYYELPASADPSSPMYDSILGPADLDRMKERLPVK
jgi:predicted Zn-dependent protease